MLKRTVAAAIAALGLAAAAGQAGAAQVIVDFEDVPVGANQVTVATEWGDVTLNLYQGSVVEESGERYFLKPSGVSGQAGMTFLGIFVNSKAFVGIKSFDLWTSATTIHHLQPVTSGEWTTITRRRPGYVFLSHETLEEFRIDNVVFDLMAVPEPSTWAMMIGGLGLAGAALRRRRALVTS